MNIKKYNSIFKKQNTKINELSKNKKHKHKNQAAVTLGKLGGKVGGPARDKSLPKARKIEIAKLGAKHRWK